MVLQVHPEGKFVVDIDKNIDMNSVTPNCRVALRNDSYVLHKILPNKVRRVKILCRSVTGERALKDKVLSGGGGGDFFCFWLLWKSTFPLLLMSL